jgi:hypothetical protein
MTERIATTETRLEDQNPPEIAYWERGQWWLAGDPHPWPVDAIVVSERLVFRPRLAPVA